ncbi:type I-G CRISPR-associated protein Csb2 [Granulicoccus sp. GXG6511]|uniref:type I-G CRISPR-associated protein Csb2 n=1 Tax=Granulicoccus sp. GXG6511 TaxID=3381351 RepID=UPI003D7D710A
MVELTITARFPLGFFQGHGHDGDTPDSYPQTARLFDALVHAAGKGSTAVVQGADLRPSETSMAALKWLEARPPDQIQMARSEANAASALSYRDQGVFEKAKGGGVVTRKTGQRINQVVAVDGAFGWHWRDVPEKIAATIVNLCPDVSCLGEADSPVVLDTTVALEQPLDRLVDAGQLSNRGISMATPTVGRIEELETAYLEANPAKAPTAAEDIHRVAKLPSSRKPAHRTIGKSYYGLAADPTPSTVPWPRALLFKSSRCVPADERVRWCVAFHRLLAHRLGDDAPAVVTGIYQQGVRKPANRVAIHYVPTGLPTRVLSGTPMFLVMLPAGIQPAEESILRRSLERAKLRLYRAGQELHLEPAGTSDLASWWAPSADGMQRWWAPVPALVPDTRRQPARNGSWTLAHAAKLAVGFAFRERFGPVPSGERGYRALVKQVESLGVEATQLTLVPDSRVEVFAHKLPEGVTCQPYRGLLRLGGLSDDSTLIALGQSRHVGGGLMMPVDVPDELSALWTA